MLAAFERVAGRARISTAKPNKNQHTPLYRLDFRLLYFISAFSYPNMAIDARSVGYLCERVKVKGDDDLRAQTPHCSSFCVFQLHKH